MPTLGLEQIRRLLQGPRRLSTSIVAGSVLLLLLVQLAVGFAINTSIERNARENLAAQLEVGENFWHNLLDQKARSLLLGAAVLAKDFGFKSALSSKDAPTLASALENNAGRIGASVSAFVDTGLHVQAMWDRDGTQGVGQAALAHIADDLARRGRGGLQGAGELALVAGLPYQFVAVPMRAPQLVGWVVMGFPIDRDLVGAMRKLSNMDVALLRQGAGQRWQIAISTLRPGAVGVLEAGDDRAVIDREAMAVRRISLVPGGGAEVLLLLSLDRAIAPYRQLQQLLLAITAIGLIVFGVGSLITVRHITTPLRWLALASERLGRGEDAEPMEHTGRRDEIGDLARAFDQMRSSLALQQAEIRQLAFWDPLTGLPNRAQFRGAVREAIEAQSDAPLAVVLVNLDRFKHVNDVLGYAFGDRLLQGVAQRLQGQALRSGDLVARLAGDEFALLLPDTDAQAALAVAERVADVFQLPMTLDDHTVDLAASFGIAAWPLHAGDADTLISRAEIAMYTAKRKTSAALIYDPAIDAGSARSLSLLSELRQALEQDELRLFLQPKIDLTDGRLCGAEALVRWQHPRRGMVPPMEFIPFAEQTGFVRKLTLWMLAATAREWPMLQALGLASVSVNLSTRDLLDHELPAKIERILQVHRMPAGALCLEITESAIMDEPLRAEATLRALSDAGFRLSIDDFGTGYSSLAYLKRLPVDELKIDKSFVMAMERDESDAKIVRSTIDLAHNLGLSVVAEGVENAAVMQRLADLGCDEAQGFHMSRPMPAPDLVGFAARWAEKSAPAAAHSLH